MIIPSKPAGYLFSSGQLRDLLEHRKMSLKDEIGSLVDEKIKELDEGDYIKEIVSKYSLIAPEIRPDDKVIHEKKETQIDVRHDRSRDIRNRNRPAYVGGESIKIAIPFMGDPTLWNFQPSSFSSHMFRGNIVHNELHLTYEYVEPDPERLEKTINHELNEITKILGWVKNDVNIFNWSLSNFAQAVFEKRWAKLLKSQELVVELGIPVRQLEKRSSTTVHENGKRPRDSASRKKTAKEYEYDVFISHASEDKESFVEDLAMRLNSPPHSLAVWYDDFSLTLGDSLRRSIDRGLANSRFGIVVLSKNFFAKEWPQKELDGLVAREDGKEKIILPIWHGVTREDVAKYSPMLADRVAVSTDKVIDYVVNKIVQVVKRSSIYMKRAETEEERLRRARLHVETKLKKRAGHRASYEAIRNEVNPAFSNELLDKLIDLNPEIFARCIIKKGNKPGITLA